jgi:D-alanine-D-alanine ligase
LNDGGAQIGNAEKSIVIPATIDEKNTSEIIQTAKEIYKSIGCTGIARVDFLYDKTYGKYYANEINTLPGTIYAHLWKKSGIELNELLSKLLNYASEVHETNKRLDYTFKSTILQNANSNKLKPKASE